jgi:hypothetical protein
MLVQFAATVFAILTAAAIVFQAALACGAPWGEWTLGGKYRGKLPPAIRLVPVLSILLLAGLAALILARAGLVALTVSPGWTWAVVAYCTAGAVANFVTPSRREKALWFPVLVVLLACSVVVAGS